MSGLPIYARDRIVRLYPTTDTSYFLVLPKGFNPKDFIKESWIKNEKPNLEPKVYTYWDVITNPIYIGFYIDKTKEIQSPKLSEIINKEKIKKQGGKSENNNKISGKVIKVEGESPNEKATVFFPSEGQKQLLLKFAKLKIVGA